MTDNVNGPLRGWVVRSNMRHDRLVWMAAKPRLEKLNHKWWHVWFSLGRTAHIDQFGIHADAMDREDVDKGMHKSMFVVDELAARFTPAESETLRLTGRLPDWFWSAYQEEVNAQRHT